MYKKIKKPLCLVILDGFGVAKKRAGNAIKVAKTPTFSFLKHYYFYTTLLAAGEAVGLPKNIVGSSEVGHLTVGAGRIIQQALTIINKEIKNGSFFKHKIFFNIATYIKKNPDLSVHIIGLLSDAGVHAHIKHVDATLKALSLHHIPCVFFHPILDGRDVPPGSSQKYLNMLRNYIKKNNIGRIASVQGRFYAMDRDNNKERTAKIVEVLTQQQEKVISLEKSIEKLKNQKDSEEFLEPIQINPAGIIKKNDVVIFLNYREERIIQLATEIKKITPQIYSMVPYEHISKEFFYPHPHIQNSLKEVLSRNKKKMLSIAETEKFAHITYFLGCEHKKPSIGETQILIPSLKLKTYAQKPNMKAPEITKTVLRALKKQLFDVYFINYANADMVGHSGNFERTVKAIECLDKQIKKLYQEIVKKQQGVLIITGDHGKTEEMFTKKEEMVTGHTKNPVPLFIICDDVDEKKLNSHSLKGLKDIAPLVLKLLKIKIPREMQL